ncbi:14030_t:CDS:1 [Funneliformis mosseae]|uniref:14030_t:CDS:1 n=1 Tax=Funneliformis mosseae TaxID=27381 RepID=A0A9N9AV39_FUNMO|nr:14030_t:CDS:1 [Funneliformis mosseae]
MKKLFDMPHHTFKPFFECPESISNTTNWHPTTLTFTPPPIQLPFPPPITAQDIVLKRPSSKICSKSPNAFFIYRKAYFDQLAPLNQRFKMTDVSKLVSLYWKNERSEVKDAYKKIAQEVEWELNERRKRDLVYPDINPNLKMARRRSKNSPSNNNVSKKKCGKVITTDNQNGSAIFERNGSEMINQPGGTCFELTFGSDMQPLIHSYTVDFENYLVSNCTLDDVVSSSSDEPLVNEKRNDKDHFMASETILDQNDVDYYVQNNSNLFLDDNDNVLDPLPAQSQNDKPIVPVENVAFDEFCFDENTNLNWYLQSFV